MTSIKRQQVFNFKYQSGQTMVFAMVFIVVILIGLIILFNTGQLTRHKMEVQNAADAAAYSAAVLTARELNYMAYSNRAMVANQVTIGQLSAYESWGKKYVAGKTKGAPPPILGYSAGYIAMAGVLLPIGGVLQALVSSISVGTVNIPYDTLYKIYFYIQWGSFQGLNGINQGISVPMHYLYLAAEPYVGVLQHLFVTHQQALRFFTLATQIETIPQIIDDNAKDARLSNFGAIATFMSAVEQQFEFLADAGTPNPAGKKSTRRFAAFVNDQRDDWTRDRRRDDLGLNLPFGLNLGIVDFSFNFELGLTAIRGGTDLRYMKNKNQEEYGWSSLDVVEGFAGFKVQINYPGGSLKFPVGLPLNFGGAAFETVEGKKVLGNKPNAVPKWKKGYYGNAFNDAYLAGQVFTNPGVIAKRIKDTYSVRKKKYPGLPSYVDINADSYPAVDKAPVFIISVRKDAKDLRTSDQIDNKKLTVGEFDVGIKTLAGGDNTNEGLPSNIIGSLSRFILEEQKKKILDRIKAEVNTYISGAIGIQVPANPPFGIPNPGQQVMDLAQIPLNKAQQQLDQVINDMQTQINKVLSPVILIDPKGAVFALAAGEVYFKNPDENAEQVMGSTFSPYWQARLVPVDEDVRHWSVITQGLKLNNPKADSGSYVEPLHVFAY